MVDGWAGGWTDGCAMSSPVSPIVANVYMETVEPH